jgi:uncharacterized membrane protein SirB2
LFFLKTLHTHRIRICLPRTSDILQFFFRLWLLNKIFYFSIIFAFPNTTNCKKLVLIIFYSRNFIPVQYSRTKATLKKFCADVTACCVTLCKNMSPELLFCHMINDNVSWCIQATSGNPGLWLPHSYYRYGQ